jgi:hypothetical protein
MLKGGIEEILRERFRGRIARDIKGFKEGGIKGRILKGNVKEVAKAFINV